AIVKQADSKIELSAQKIKEGKYPKDGLSFLSHIAGLLGQRLWFYRKTARYTDKLKISEECIGCGLCASLCPMKNISIIDGKAVANNKCTICYRCISRCPEKAITLEGDEVIEQCRFEKYC
ncbi:MAG: EFR1 family ferrodoxin, partial [Candidatus Coproplasma sp.]